MRFEEEEVKVVALGSGWVAAVTSLNFLRIFSDGGLQVCHINSVRAFDENLFCGMPAFIINLPICCAFIKALYWVGKLPQQIIVILL